MKLGIVTPSLRFSGQPISLSFVKIFISLSDEVLLITNGFDADMTRLQNKVSIKQVGFGRDSRKSNGIIEYVLIPLRICFNMIAKMRDADVVVFLLGNISLTLPMLTAKLMGRKTALILTGLYSKNAEGFLKDSFLNRLKIWLFRRVEEVNFALSDVLIGYTEGTLPEFGLSKYKSKYTGDGTRFVDTDVYKVTNALGTREKKVGYIGRFRGEKGIMNFIDSLPLISEDSIRFVAVGDGPLFDEVTQKVKMYQDERVTVVRWVLHDKVAEYLNQLKLLVIPSHSETGPYIALEAMACGTPVLATPVGFIPDIIKDGVTGFILEDNSPQSIANGVARALGSPDLEKLASNAGQVIQSGYSYEAAVERYRKILVNQKK